MKAEFKTPRQAFDDLIIAIGKGFHLDKVLNFLERCLRRIV